MEHGSTEEQYFVHGAGYSMTILLGGYHGA